MLSVVFQVRRTVIKCFKGKLAFPSSTLSISMICAYTFVHTSSAKGTVAHVLP